MAYMETNAYAANVEVAITPEMELTELRRRHQSMSERHTNLTRALSQQLSQDCARMERECMEMEQSLKPDSPAYR